MPYAWISASGSGPKTRSRKVRCASGRFSSIRQSAWRRLRLSTGRFVRINRKYCDIVGYSPEEMLGRAFQSITHPGDLETSLRNTARLMAGEVDSYTMEKRYIHRNGETVWVNLTVSPLWAAGEERDFHVAVVEDITERKRAEESLQQSNARIRHLNDVLRAIRDVGSLINTRERSD